MTFSTKLKIGVLAAAVAWAAWQIQQHALRTRELATVNAEIRARQQELADRSQALEVLQRRNRELVEAERRAGNHALIALMRERAAITRADSAPRSVRNTLADLLTDPEQRAIDREQVRNQVKAGNATFIKLLKLSPEQIDQYVELNTDKECRTADRMSALLHGKISLADALRERDEDNRASEQRLRAIIGEEGYAFYQSIADGMRTDEAKRVTKSIQDNMGDNQLNPDQSDRLQQLIKNAVATVNMDDTDLFRSPDDWAQCLSNHQEKVLQEAAAFLSSTQMDSLRMLATADREQKKEEMILKRKSAGIK